MNKFVDVIDQWPTMAMLASDTGISYDRVKKWRQRNSIPADAWKSVLRAARRRGYKVKATDLIQLASNAE